MKATPALASNALLAGVLWLFAGVLAVLFAVGGPTGVEGVELIVGIAAGLAWPLYEATGDMDRLRLRRIVPAPAAIQPSVGRAVKLTLGGTAVGAAVLALAYLILPADALDVTVVGLAIPTVSALAVTGRVMQLWWWQREHPGERLLYLSDQEGTWMASQARSAAPAAEAAFGR
ncbi:MAG: hypothetical protein ACEQSX_00500 [Baekduiaceae bacterium]